MHLILFRLGLCPAGFKGPTSKTCDRMEKKEGEVGEKGRGRGGREEM